MTNSSKKVLLGAIIIAVALVALAIGMRLP